MRFISLKTKFRYVTCYYRLLTLGSGPNFVLNRLDEFKAMIKDQGAKFWFRFWLNFCFYPEIIEDPLYVSPHTVNVMRILCDILHKNFLEGSPKDAINYCLETLSIMTEKENEDEDTNEKKNVNEENRVKQSEEEKNSNPDEEKKLKQENERLKKKDFDSLAAYIQFLFGCALCEVFYVWLEANQVGPSTNYWSVPEVYLKWDFQPRLLEHYIIHTWGIRVFRLLGVNRITCPWVNVLMTERKKLVMSTSDAQGKTCCDKKGQNEVECWNTKLRVMKTKLMMVDDMYDIKEEKKEPENKMKDSDKVASDKCEKVIPRCSFCFNTDSYITKLKKCSLCVNAQKDEPKYYCGISCQTEDWFRNHAKEHVKLFPYLKIKPSAIERSAEAESKLFTLSLFDNNSDT